MKYFSLVGVMLRLVFVAPLCAADEETGDWMRHDPYLYNEIDFAESVEFKPHFVMFFAPWCEHCDALKPAWAELSNFYHNENSGVITIAKVDCTTDTKLCSENMVIGYPTLKLFRPGKDAVRHSGERDFESLKLFISQTLEKGTDVQEKPAVDVNDGLYELTSDTFGGHVSNGQHFILFFAPWCGHCKRMEPAWKKLASKMKDSVDVKIGRVDCTKNQRVCSGNGVRGYPTLKWFKVGREVEAYTGGRTLGEFINYVHAMTAARDHPDTQDERIVAEEKEIDGPDVVDGLFELDLDNFEALTTNVDFFVKFYAPWCGHCRQMEPAWKELAKFHEDSDEVRIGRVDCSKHSALCQKMGIRGYPTLKYFRDGREMKGSPEGRDFDSMKRFVEKMSSMEEDREPEQYGHEEAVPVSEGGAIELNDENFRDIAASGLAFVKFYAPWCGHCKRLAPVWDDLAREDFGETDMPVLIGKVDCTKYSDICTDNEVRGYPTLKLFLYGETRTEYQGARNLKALKDFVLENIEDIAEPVQEQSRDEL